MAHKEQKQMLIDAIKKERDEIYAKRFDRGKNWSYEMGRYDSLGKCLELIEGIL